MPDHARLHDEYRQWPSALRTAGMYVLVCPVCTAVGERDAITVLAEAGGRHAVVVCMRHQLVLLVVHTEKDLPRDQCAHPVCQDERAGVWKREAQVALICVGCRRELPLAAFAPDGQVRVEELVAHDLLELAFDAEPQTWCWHCLVARLGSLVTALTARVAEHAILWAPA